MTTKKLRNDKQETTTEILTLRVRMTTPGGDDVARRNYATALLVGLGVGEALVDFVPVDDVPPGGEVVWPAVVVFQVVGVLPDIVAEDGVEAVGEGRVLVGGGDDGELAGLEDEPAPAGAELLGGGFVEELLEALEVAEVGLDLGGDVAMRLAAAFGLHDLPEHGVVDVAAAVVADGAADVLGDGGEVLDEVFDGPGTQFGVLFDGGVQVGDVGLVVLVVVEFHGRLVDVGFEGGVVVGKRWNFKGHWDSSVKT